MKHPPSIVGPKAYTRRWGTWRKALKAFVEWSKDEESDETSVAAAMPRSGLSGAGSARDDRVVRPGLRFKVFMRDRFRCVACGRSPATHLDVALHADHVVSVYDGGMTVFDNLQTLCEDCNLGKGRTSARARPE
jgi:hypothetical protein